MVQLFAAPPKKEVLPVIPQDRPVYRILNEQGFFGPDDTLHPEGEILVLWDTPNEDMEPLNELAQINFEKYIDTLEESAKIVADKHGRHFAGRPRSKEEMIENATMAKHAAQTTANPHGVRIMGAKKNSKKRIQALGAEETVSMNAGDSIQEARHALVEKLA